MDQYIKYMETQKSMLPKNFIINNHYKVLLFIKHGSNADTYRVKSNDGNLYFLKLFNTAKVSRSSFDAENNLLEIEFLKRVTHKNIVSYKDSGELIHDNKKYIYLVLDFIAGETLAERIARESFTSTYDVQLIIADVLNALNYLHTLPDPIIHNEVTPQNIMLDMSGFSPKAILIDFGYARSFHQTTKAYNKEGLNPNYVASECFNNLFSPQSDLFSVGVIMYQLIFCKLPWQTEVSKIQARKGNAKDLILEARSKPLKFPMISDKFVGYEESLNLILKKALSNDIDNRFNSVSEFISALNGEIIVEDIDKVQKVTSGDYTAKRSQSKKTIGKGFDAIAGMAELKQQLKLDVIDALNNPDEYSKYGVTIPNGMLLYGPPGCGKTFFAKHFAEEVGFNFMQFNPGTLKSRYVNATEENISKMFQEAEKNAPTIIFIEEISGLFPSRDSDAHEMSKNAVEAMLAEMDRTGEKGIFVLCTTNYPDKVDAALLRAGRLDKKFYLSPPDFEARKALFEMYLKSRPLDLGIDYDKLARMTENYVSSDIKDLIVDEASRQALKLKSRISMSILESVIQITRPSVSLQELKKYDLIKSKIEGQPPAPKNERTPVGFKLNSK